MTLIKELLQQIEQEVKNAPTTMFDSIDVSLNVAMTGAAIRDRIGEIQNLLGKINEDADKAIFYSNYYELRKKESEELAATLISKREDAPRIKGTLRKALIATAKVKLMGDDKETTYLEEYRKWVIYSYLASRGKSKVKEAMTALDCGRSILSWDREEYKRTGQEG